MIALPRTVSASTNPPTHRAATGTLSRKRAVTSYGNITFASMQYSSRNSTVISKEVRSRQHSPHALNTLDDWILNGKRSYIFLFCRGRKEGKVVVRNHEFEHAKVQSAEPVDQTHKRAWHSTVSAYHKHYPGGKYDKPVKGLNQVQEGWFRRNV